MSKQEIKSLTGIRGVAAFGVFLSHASFLGVFGILGAAGVTMFFVLSGFVMAYTYEKCSFKEWSCCYSFWWKRFARIVPLHWIALLIALIQLKCLVSGRCDVLSFGYTVAQIPVTIFLIHEWFTPGLLMEWNPPCWTLSEEQFFYLLFPLLTRIPTRLLPHVVVMCILPTFLALFIAPDMLYDNGAYLSAFIHQCVILRACDFTLGILTAKIVLETPKERLRNISVRGWNLSTTSLCLRITPLLILLLLFVLPLAYPQRVPSVLGTSTMAPLFALLIGGLAIHDIYPSGNTSWVNSFLSWSPVYSFGKISFSFYLIHYSFPYYFQDLIDPVVFVLIWFWFVVGLSTTLHVLVEGPLYKKLLTWKNYSCGCISTPILLSPSSSIV